MCVAVLVESKDPTPDEIRAMARTNPDGGGVAWVDGALVHYRRGLTAERAIALVARIPRPYFMHFRIATRGKPIPALTHPFPVGFAAISSADELRGMAQAVIMHNGTWQDFRKYVPHGIDADAVSDTQIAAYVVGVQGEDILDHVPWSNAIMRAAGDGRANITLRGGWTDHNGNQYSNLHWQRPAIDDYDYGYGQGGFYGRGGGAYSYTQWSKNGSGVYDRSIPSARTSERFKTPPRGLSKYNSSGILTPDSPAGERAVHESPSVLSASDAREVAADIERDLAARAKVSRRELKTARKLARREEKRRTARDTQPMLALPEATPISDADWDAWLLATEKKLAQSDGVPEVIPESQRGVAESISGAIEMLRLEDLDDLSAASTIKLPRAVAANANTTRVAGDEESEVDPPHESEIDLVDLMEGSAKSRSSEATNRASDRYLDRDWDAIDREIRSQGIKV